MSELPETESWSVIVRKLLKMGSIVCLVLAAVLLMSRIVAWLELQTGWIPSSALSDRGHAAFVESGEPSTSAIRFPLIRMTGGSGYSPMDAPVQPDWEQVVDSSIEPRGEMYGGPRQTEYPLGFKARPLEKSASSPRPADPNFPPPLTAPPSVSGRSRKYKVPCFEIVVRNDGDQPVTCSAVGIHVVARHHARLTGNVSSRIVNSGFDGVILDCGEVPVVGQTLTQTFRSVRMDPGEVHGSRVQLHGWLASSPSVIRIVFIIDDVPVMSPEIYLEN